MTMMAKWQWLAAIVVAALAGGASAATQSGDIIIRHVAVIDVEHGRSIADQAVVTRGPDIVAVGPDRDVAKAWIAARSVDGRTRFLIPGLWDMHVHFGGGPGLEAENKALLPLYIANGITSVRDCAGDLAYDVLAWRDAIAKGTQFGPTLYTSGPKIEGLKPVWKGTLETGSKADIDAAVAKLQGLKVDFVKITDSTLDPQLFLYAISKALAAGLKVSGHIPAANTIEQAVDAGISSIEHLDYAYKAGSHDEAAIVAAVRAGLPGAEANARFDASFDPATAAVAYRNLAAHGVVVTPTLNISRIVAYLDTDKHQDDAYLAYIGPNLRKTYDWRIKRAAKADAAQVAARHAHFERMARILPLLQANGVTIMAGTDAGFLNSFDYPGVGLHDELAMYVRYGLTPAQALASATRAGPAWFGKLDRYGAVTLGRAADLTLLDANPLVDIAATRRISAVILRGQLQDRAALDGLLADAKRQVTAWSALAQ